MIFGRISRIKLLLLLCVGFASQLSGQEISGREAADRLLEEVGGKELWASTRTLYAKEYAWFSSFGERVTQDVWRDMEVPANRIELRSKTLKRARAWTLDRGWGVLEDGREYEFSEARLKNESGFWSRDIYILYHRMAKEDSRLSYVFKAPELTVYEDQQLIGRFMFNSSFQPVRWTSFGEGDNVDYLYGPLVDFGPFRMPKWGVQADDYFRFEYLAIEGSEEAPTVSFELPSQRIHQGLMYRWKPGLSDAQKNELLDLFRGLVAEVKGIEDLKINEIEQSSDDYNLLIQLVFASNEALEAYQAHTLHDQIEQAATRLTQYYRYFRYH